MGDHSMRQAREDAAGWLKLAAASSWLLVAGCALGISCWSLAYVSHHWGVPFPINWAVSSVYDGVALILATIALSAARQGDSTLAPSMGLAAFAGLSAWFNSWHAELLGLPVAARIFYACPPVAAVLVTELQLRHNRRGALRARGRIADPLPAFGLAMWFHKPWSTYWAVREILAHRQKVKKDNATLTLVKLPSTTQPAPPVQVPSVTKRDTPPAIAPVTPPVPVGSPVHAGGRAEPRPERPAASGAPARRRVTTPPRRQPASSRGNRTSLDPERRADILREMRDDLARGAHLSKAIVTGTYSDVTPYHAEVLLREARAAVGQPNGKVVSLHG